ncbi:MAG TPA: hypothetical protein VLS91_03245 [Acidimicrobiales bacterium]|nr:hypothetical protein [Acidimicrobiales bacterium]
MSYGEGSPRGTAALRRHVGDMVNGAPVSAARFADGAHFRIEIPSVENPAALRAVVEEARDRNVTVHRTSQGSGAMLLTQDELREMARIGADEGLEVNLFIGPREEFGIGGAVRSPDGLLLSGRLRGSHQLRYAIEDVERAVEAGIRGFLIADTGLMEILAAMQREGELPRSVVWKISAVLAPSNPVAFRQLVEVGGTTVNVPSDMNLHELAELRALSAAPIDLYLEAPDSLGGVVRGHELAEIALVAAPLYAKFGLRNARAVYPAGLHLDDAVVGNVREKVRRAQLALEWLDASGVDLVMSKPGAEGIGVPEP